MEVRGSVRLFSWTQLCFILLLSENVELKHEERYTAPNGTVLLSIPECRVVKGDTIVWKTGGKESVRLAKWKDYPPFYDKECEKICELREDGSLTLRKTNEETTEYIMTAHTKEGTERCTGSVRVIVQDRLAPPLLLLSCSSDPPSVSCSSSAPSLSGLTLSWRGRSHNTSEKTIQRTIKEQNVEVTCSARNRVSKNSTTIAVICTGGWSIYLIASVAGGAVFFIIFIVLVVCVVKYKPWRRQSPSEEDEEINRPQPNAVRQQTQPPDPAQRSHGDYSNQTTITRQEPGGKRERPGRGRRPPPQAPGEATKMYSMVPPPKTVPALPGNHPNEQTPRPQPRTKSKPPRNKHRQDCP